MEKDKAMDIKKRNSCILYAVGVVLLLCFDQITKYMASTFLKGGNSIVIIKNVFQLHYLENQGAGFGVLQGQRLWFVIITLILLILMVIVYLRTPMEKRYRWIRLILLLITAGAIGNLIDRLRFGYVVDFFYFELINFPVFNVADIYVTCGMILLLVLVLFYYKDSELEVLWPFKKRKKSVR